MQGIDQDEATRRLATDGPNAITPPKKRSAVRMFLGHLCGLLNLLLMISGVLSLILFAIDPASIVNLYLGIILFFVSFANAFIDFYQQFQTAAILESFLSLVPPEATVIRGQSLISLPASHIVKGDVLYLKAGDKIPADCRLFSETDMKVDNSSITGESEAQERTVNCTQASPLEATNLAFSGTNVVNGEGFGIAIRTGDRSVLGQIAKMTIGETTPLSQLTREINSFIRVVASVAIVTAIVFFIVGLVLGYDIGITFSFAIGIFVAYVPQGLPATVSVNLVG